VNCVKFPENFLWETFFPKKMWEIFSEISGKFSRKFGRFLPKSDGNYYPHTRVYTLERAINPKFFRENFRRNPGENFRENFRKSGKLFFTFSEKFFLQVSCQETFFIIPLIVKSVTTGVSSRKINSIHHCDPHNFVNVSYHSLLTFRKIFLWETFFRKKNVGNFFRNFPKIFPEFQVTSPRNLRELLPEYTRLHTGKVQMPPNFPGGTSGELPGKFRGKFLKKGETFFRIFGKIFLQVSWQETFPAKLFRRFPKIWETFFPNFLKVYYMLPDGQPLLQTFFLNIKLRDVPTYFHIHLSGNVILCTTCDCYTHFLRELPHCINET